MRLLSTILCSIFVCFRSTSALAQGLDPALNVDLPTTVQHGSDIAKVDLQSGALTITIPLFHLKGRGLDTDFVFTDISKLWHFEAIDNDPVRYFELYYEDNRSNMTTPNIGQTRMGVWDGLWNATPLYSEATPYIGKATSTFRQNTGPVTTLVNTGGLIGITPMNPSGFWSIDGSYMYGDALDGWIYYKDGVRTRFVNTYVDDGSQPAYYQDSNVLEDSNGNKIECGNDHVIGSSTRGQYICTDTLGRKIIYTSRGIQYIDSLGTPRFVGLTYGSGSIPLSYPVHPPAGCSEPGAYTEGCLDMSGGNMPESFTVTLGDGSAYRLDYLRNPDGSTTGEIGKITLPTGGYVRFEYGWLWNNYVDDPSNPNNFDVLWEAAESASARAVIKRFESEDGTAASEKMWSYDYACPVNYICGPPSGYTQTTTVTDPIGNKHIETFVQGATPDAYLAPISYVSSSEDRDSQGTVLRHVDNTTAFDATAYSVLPTDQGRDNPRIIKSVETRGGVSGSLTTEMQYDAYGNVKDEQHSDFDGSLLRWDEHTYLPTAFPSYAAYNIHILDKLTSTLVHDTGYCTSPVNGICASSTLGYDNYVNAYSSALVTKPGIVEHDDSDRDVSYLTRGNVTSETRLAYPTAPPQTATSQQRFLTYDSLGNVLSTIDWNGNSTTFDYTDNFWGGGPSFATNARPTKITRPATANANHIERREYYWNTGLLAAICGENFPASASCDGQANLVQPDLTAYKYDSVGRPTLATFGDEGFTALNYPDFNHVELTNAIGLDRWAVYDGLGRLVQTQLRSDPNGTDYVDIQYDALSRVYSKSNPYHSASDPTYGLSYSYYDGLSRLIKQSQPGGNNNLRWCYDGLALPGQIGCSTNHSSLANDSWIDVYDETGRHSQQVKDGLGRLVAVMEPDAQTGALALETDYGYDPMGNLSSVNQAGAGGETSRTRSFAYDSLSRLRWSQNPEAGLLCFGLGDGTIDGCQANGYDANGNLLYKTDAGGIETASSYDALNRLQRKWYINDPSSLPWSCYLYDTAPSNGIGRLGKQWTQKGTPNGYCTSAPGSGTLTETKYLAYDAMGRVTSSQQCVLTNCAPASSPFPLTQRYDLAGNMTFWDNGMYGFGSPLIGFGSSYDGAGRLGIVQSSWADRMHPPILFSVQSYTPAGGLQNWTLGNNLNMVHTYDSRLRVTSETATVP